MNLILASTSPYRRALVERLGVPFRSVAPPIDEQALKDELTGIAPGDLAHRLAMAKATSVSSLEPEAIVIGGDQLVTFDGSVLGKPGTSERAIAQLQMMSGRWHELITAIVVRDRDTTYAHTNVTKLLMRRLTHESVLRYVSSDFPVDCAGSYKLEAKGIALFERIESDDHSAIVGVPLIALTSILRTIGFEIP